MIGLLEKASKRQLLLLTSLLGIWMGVVAYMGWRQFVKGENAEASTVDDFQTVHILLPEEPITEIPTRPVRDAWSIFQPDEMVLGITVGGESRAYPLNVLNSTPAQKVLNDTLGGRPMAVTF